MAWGCVRSRLVGALSGARRLAWLGLLFTALGATGEPFNGVRLERDIAYGSHPLQTYDLYVPQKAAGSPVIFMVHGGGWRRGDKSHDRVVDDKVAHWLPKGFVLVSVNYRLIPDATPLEQALDVVNALKDAQQRALSWGADPKKFILMGHSAGAHLVALISSDPQHFVGDDLYPWLGAVLLDTAAFDLVALMEGRHLRLYDRAFGRDRAVWERASPYHRLAVVGPPMLAVCSSRRKDQPCRDAQRFAAKASTLGRMVAVMEQELSHREINMLLGQPGGYTQAVDDFFSTLGVNGQLPSEPSLGEGAELE